MTGRFVFFVLLAAALVAGCEANRKTTSSGHELDLATEDLYDQLQLDQRTGRILPNSACLLPPKQTFTRGNAYLTCDEFVTDASYLDEHEQQHTRLVEARDDAHRKRAGRPMSDDNIWKAERLKEQASLATIIDVLKRPEVQDGVSLRGAGEALAAAAEHGEILSLRRQLGTKRIAS